MAKTLWQGKVAVKWTMFGLQKYAVITDREIIIRANSKPDSKIIHQISKENIISIESPKYGTAEIMFTGISGFTVKYKDQEKTKTVSFWSAAFGAIMDTAGMEKIYQSLKILWPSLEETTINKKEADKYMSYYFGAIGASFAGFFIFGLIGGILFLISSGLTIVLIRSEKMSTTVKVLLGALIWIITLGICGAILLLYIISAFSEAG